MTVTHKVQIWAGGVLGLSASMITLTWEKEKARAKARLGGRKGSKMRDVFSRKSLGQELDMGPSMNGHEDGKFGGRPQFGLGRGGKKQNKSLSKHSHCLAASYTPER